jgi:EpsI family protein
MNIRLSYLLALATILLATGFSRALAQAEPTATQQPLQAFPLNLRGWQGETDYFAPDVVNALRVDDYILRRYQDSRHRWLWLYVGYWGAQRLGDTRVHSPAVCLPGAGWVITRYGITPIPIAGGTILVNSDVIQKGNERQIVLYWYQIHGKVVAKELRAMGVLAWTSLTQRRSDEALVRVNAPITSSVEDAVHEGAAFLEAAFPSLARLLPR